MKITVFTGNQPRHVALVEELTSVADEVYAVHEVTTVFPGKVEDFFRKTPVMQDYFSRVIEAERLVFGAPRFTPSRARALILKMGDVNGLRLEQLEPALNADLFVVFGASFIKGELCDLLVEKGAYNIHMGVSPFYRGDSCNFWAMYDKRPEYVGATIHLLTKGLDSGPMLFHALPAPMEVEPFELGMRAVKAAHSGLIKAIQDRKLHSMQPVRQDRSLEMRYSRNKDFTDEAAQEYLGRLCPRREIMRLLGQRDLSAFLRPIVI